MDEKTLLEYWLALYRRKGVIFTIIVSAMVTAGVLTKTIPAVYEAKAVFFVPRTSDSTAFLAPPAGSMVRSVLVPVTKEDDQGPYIGVLKSRMLAERVHAEFPQKSVGDLMRRDLDWRVSDEFLIEVYARDRDPVVAAGVANAYVKHFNELMGGYSLPSQRQIQSTIEKEIQRYREGLADAQEAVRRFQEKNKTANLDEETKQLIAQKASFESQLDNARVQYRQNLKKIVSTKGQFDQERAAFKGSSVLMNSDLLTKLKGQLVDLEAQIAALRTEKKETHPEVVALRRNYEEVKRNIAAEVERILASQVQAPDTFVEDLRRQLINLYVDNEKLGATMQALEHVIAGLKERLLEIPKLQKQRDLLTLEVDRYKKLLETLTTNLEETGAQSRRPPHVAVVVDPASPPTEPSFPLLGLNLVVAFIAGLAGGVFYALFLDYLESTREKRLFRLVRAIELSER